MASSLTSPAVGIQFLDNVGIMASWTGTPTGTFAVQVSVDTVTWVPITLSPAITASGSADQAYFELNQLSAPYIRLVYTASSGSGTLNALVTAKMI